MKKILALCLALCVSLWAGPERALTLFHLNDTHSHLDPTPIQISLSNSGEGKVWVEAGGYARIASLLAQLRRDSGDQLFFHAGDFFSGTLYFTEYLGAVDNELLPLLKLSGFTFGNHEFDRGPKVLGDFLSRFSNDILPLSANIDFGAEAALARRVKPYGTFKAGKLRIGAFGLTTPSTPNISSPGPNLAFLAASNAAARALAALAKEKPDLILAVSHLGYSEDLALARQFPAIGVILGGHSHTLLGDFRPLGLRPSGEYPSVVRHEKSVTLVAQAWEWGKVLGALDLWLDGRGRIVRWKAREALVLGKTLLDSNRAPLPPERAKAFMDGARGLPVAFVDEDPAVAKALARYRGTLEALSRKVVATASRDLLHIRLPGQTHGSGVVLAKGSVLAPIIATAFLEKGRALDGRVAAAFVNVGGVRREIPKGDITAAMVYEVLPFANTMVFLDLTGDELKRLLETTVAMEGFTVGSLYHAGLSFSVQKESPIGSRVKDLCTLTPSGLRPVAAGDTVRIATFSYLAGGGDRLAILKNAPGERVDTGFIDAEILMEYLAKKKVAGD